MGMSHGKYFVRRADEQNVDGNRLRITKADPLAPTASPIIPIKFERKPDFHPTKFLFRFPFLIVNSLLRLGFMIGVQYMHSNNEE